MVIEQKTKNKDKNKNKREKINKYCLNVIKILSGEGMTTSFTFWYTDCARNVRK